MLTTDREAAWFRCFASLLASVAFLTLEVCALAATGGADMGLLGGLALFGYLLPWAFALGGLLLGTWSLARRVAAPLLEGHGGAGVVRPAALAIAPALSLFLGGAYVLELKLIELNNHELAALLLAALLLGLLLGAGLLWAAAFSFFRAHPERPWARRLRAALTIAAPALLLGLVGLLLARNRRGLSIIGGWFFAGPSALIVTLAGLGLARRRLQALALRARLGVVVCALLSGPIAAGLGFADETLGPTVAKGSGWSAHLIRLARAATDVDGDGFSSLFGGGDCAPFDPARNPAALEVPQDGVDNDCFGGDEATLYELPRPTWVPRPPALSKIDNAIVVVIEALRSDAVSFLGEPSQRPPSTPNIDRLAARSIVFPNTYSSAAATVWSLGSLWTTLPPSQLPWRRHASNNLRYLPDEVTFFYEHLQRSGFETHAFTFDHLRFRLDGGIGLERGFTTYDAKTSRGGFRTFPSGRMVDRALARVAAAERPFFLWLHLVEPHAPYRRNPGAPDFGKSAHGRYLSEVWGADRQVGRLIAGLRARDLLDRTAIFITGDHGESFGERGRKRHGAHAYDDQVRTALVLWAPGATHRIVEAPISHQDIGSTLLNLVGARAHFDALHGRNLMPLILGEPHITPDSVIVETHAPGRPMVALIKGRLKLVYERSTGSGQLFNLADDPKEQRDLSGRLGDRFVLMMRELRAYLATQVAIE